MKPGTTVACPEASPSRAATATASLERTTPRARIPGSVKRMDDSMPPYARANEQREVSWIAHGASDATRVVVWRARMST